MEIATDIDRILDLVDLPPSTSIAKPVSLEVEETPTRVRDPLDQLPPAIRQAVTRAGSDAYHLARRNGLSQEAAILRGRAAAERELDLLMPGLTDDARVQHVAPSKPAQAAPPQPALLTSSQPISEEGRARSQRDVDALTAAGFAMAAPLYERGTVVLEAGVENARAARAEYEALPLVGDVCAQLAETIRAEDRRIVKAKAAEIGMERDGRVRLSASGTSLPITEHAFAGLVERLGYGGASYLLRCKPELRAHNVNSWRSSIALEEHAKLLDAIERGWDTSKAAYQPKELAARVRDLSPAEGVPTRPEIFAVVSTGYPTFDADQIAEAFALAMPTDARGTVRYDPSSTGTRFEALFHSTVAPEHFVAGEVFRTGIRVRANDAGDGSIVVRAVALQNLCLNLIVIDRACKEIARIRHVGSVAKLAEALKIALRKATAALAPFLRQWGYACEESLRERLSAEGVALPASDDEVMRGIFGGLLDARKVRFPRTPGVGREGILDALVESWRLDHSSATQQHGGLTRAAVVNAITRTAQRWIHEADPWATDGIEIDAARLLWGCGAARPVALTFAEPTEVQAAAPAPGLFA